MFDFPTAPTAGTEYTSGGVTYIFDGSVWNLKSGGELTDYVLRAGDTMSGALDVIAQVRANNYLSDGLFSFGQRLSANLDDPSHIEIYSGPNAMGIGTTTGGQFNFICKHADHAFNFRLGGTERASIDKDGIGPRSSYNVTWQNGFTGTMDFRVNPAMVSLRMIDLKRNVAATAGASVKICDYPSGVPAPWGTLQILTLVFNTAGTPQSNGWVHLEARTDGVWFWLANNGSMNNSDHRVGGTITWSR